MSRGDAAPYGASAHPQVRRIAVVVTPAVRLDKASRLVPGVHRACAFRHGIGDSADVSDQGLNIRLAQGVPPSRHECGFLQGRSAMRDDGREIGIADLVQRVAFGKRMRLHLKVVKVRYALGRRLWIMTTLAILIVETTAQVLLVAESDFFQLEFDFLVRLVERGGG